tara:strand:+ start:249 stop:1271 length:1023 start_codon:yes stop_codon:yes gene_type:complete
MLGGIFKSIARILPFPYVPLPIPPGSRVEQSNVARSHYPSVSKFTSMMKSGDHGASYSNLFSVHFKSPPMMYDGNKVLTNKLRPDSGELKNLLDYYCSTLNLPSKQITTGQTVIAGAAQKYPTGSAFSQMNMSFLMPRSQETRNFFEKWMMMMAPDANQYVDYYKNYCAPEVLIFKWERGGGEPVGTDPYMNTALRQSGDQNVNVQGKIIRPWYQWKKYKLTACWRLMNVFPYNIGSIQMNNNAARTLNLTVGFMYERYRFYCDPIYDDQGNNQLWSNLVPFTQDSDYSGNNSSAGSSTSDLYHLLDKFGDVYRNSSSFGNIDWNAALSLSSSLGSNFFR